MEDEEILKKEESLEEKGIVKRNFEEMNRNSKSLQEVYTTITDNKKLFNLENACDYKLNDCKGELIRVCDVLIKRIKTPLEEPIVNEETGEVKEYEYKMITIIVDDEGKSYVTASKSFTIEMMRYCNTIGLEDIKNGKMEIKIIEKPVKNSSNKCLAFELV